MGIDMIGSGDKVVALVEIEDSDSDKIIEVARRIMEENKNVKTVIERVHGVKGKFRLREHKIIIGDQDTEVLHREYGYSLKLDPRVVYFSPRESTVRQHIAKQVKPGERVLVMFAGVGPYAICIGKTQPKVKEIVAAEVNPRAVEYMRENIRINKLSHIVTPLDGDVNDTCAAMNGEFDRVIMPMIEAREFLVLAAKCAKPGGVIHAYMVSDESELYNDSERFISEVFGKSNVSFEVVGRRKISLYSPGKWKVLIEIMVK